MLLYLQTYNIKTIIPHSQKFDSYWLCASQIFKTVNQNTMNKVFPLIHENIVCG